MAQPTFTRRATLSPISSRPSIAAAKRLPQTSIALTCSGQRCARWYTPSTPPRVALCRWFKTASTTGSATPASPNADAKERRQSCNRQPVISGAALSIARLMALKAVILMPERGAGKTSPLFGMPMATQRERSRSSARGGRCNLCASPFFVSAAGWRHSPATKSRWSQSRVAASFRRHGTAIRKRMKSRWITSKPSALPAAFHNVPRLW